ncbi:MAG: hypothetical protein JNN15_00030 [Blastocatellia bacterium]|nr:hypothetical protein [Blastocatellia bacterium]
MSFFGIIKKIVLWSYDRGTWQYDLLCIMILAFIFLTPSWVFDKRLKAETRAQVYEKLYVSASDIANANRSLPLAQMLSESLSRKTRQQVTVKHYEFDFDSKGNIQGFQVWFDHSR